MKIHIKRTIKEKKMTCFLKKLLTKTRLSLNDYRIIYNDLGDLGLDLKGYLKGSEKLN
jgi:ribosomal protein L5